MCEYMYCNYVYVAFLTFWQVNYEQQLDELRQLHQRTLIQCKEDKARLLADSDVSMFKIDEESIRKKYSKDTEHIKVIHIASQDSFILLLLVFWFSCLFSFVCYAVPIWLSIKNLAII